MIIRFEISNVLSFGPQKEFTMLAKSNLKTLKEHIYAFGDVEVLKLSVLYGANGAGKSNLINGLAMLQDMVLRENIPTKLRNGQFKFQENKEDVPQVLAIQFIQNGLPFYYGLAIKNGVIITEELYEFGTEPEKDKMIFERNMDDLTKITHIQFSEEFEKEEKNKLLKEILLKEFIKPNKPILKLIADRENKDLLNAKLAYNWFKDVLTIIGPDSRPTALAHYIDTDEDFKKYAIDLMCSFSIGIESMSVTKRDLEDFKGKDDGDAMDKLIEKIDEAPNKMIGIVTKKRGEVVFVKEDNQVFVKNLQVQHKGANDIVANFDLEEESDGTIRLLDFVPAFRDVILNEKVYVIDEIERSIHPLLVKELVSKFSDDKDTKGQLLFTTHESNLLDQEIFRQDEIWFAEKDHTGSTDLYSLSAFKEHKTIDIQKGYLSGRYGSIPFLGNLRDLNWHDHASKK